MIAFKVPRGLFSFSLFFWILFAVETVWLTGFVAVTEGRWGRAGAGQGRAGQGEEGQGRAGPGRGSEGGESTSSNHVTLAGVV